VKTYKGTALVQLKPAALDSEIKRRLVFGWLALCWYSIAPLSRSIRSGLHIGLVSIGELDDLASGGFGVGIGARLNEFVHQ
jgi:hypothetical protein